MYYFALSRKILLLSAMVLLYLNVMAQSVTLNNTPPQTSYSPAHVFGQLDYSELTTGLHVDRALQFTDPNLFNGADDAPQANPDRMQLLQATLFGSIVDRDALFPPNQLGHPIHMGEDITFKVMLFAYEQLHENALSKGWVQISNNQILDVSGPDATPYEKRTTVAAAPWYTGQLDGNTTYTFTPEIMSNMADQIQNVKLDWGAGYTDFNVGQSISISPGAESSLKFSLRIQLINGDVLYANSRISVDPAIQAITTPGIHTIVPSIPVYPGQTPNVADGETDMLSIATACPDGTIRRPLLIINGFEAPLLPAFFGVNFNSVLTGLRFLAPSGNRIIDDLATSGYDIIFLDFKDETLSLEHNAQVVKDAITIINDLKTTDQPLTVIGISMGGLVGKLALREMELAGEDHEVNKFFSFDSPLRGANIPIGFQHLVFHTNRLANQYGIEGVGVFLQITAQEWIDLIGFDPTAAGAASINAVSTLNNAVATVLSESPRQMLLMQNLLVTNLQAHDDFYEYFFSLGALEQCEHIAISNGSMVGADQGFNASDLMIDAGGTTGQIISDLSGMNGDLGAVLIDVVGNLLLQTGGMTRFRTWAAADDNNHKVYEGIVVNRVFGIPITHDFEQIRYTGTQALDNAPGGAADFGVADGDIPAVSIPENRFCFIPTISALEVGPYAGPGTSRVSPYTVISNPTAVLALPQTTMDRFVATDDFTAGSPLINNVDHPRFTSDIAGVLLSEIKNGAALPVPGVPNLTSTFNYGDSRLLYNFFTPPTSWSEFRTEPIIDADLTVTGAGLIWVNGNDRIGFITNSGNQLNATNSHYEVDITTGYCTGDPTTLTLENGGRMDVGDWSNENNTGAVNIYDNATLLVAAGGEAKVRHASAIRVKNGGELVVANGGVLIAEHGGHVSIEDGGTLTVQTGGVLRISQYSDLEIEAGGRLIIEAGASVQLWDGPDPDGAAVIKVKGILEVRGEFKFTGNGYFQFHPHHELALPGGIFKLTGEGQSYRFIEILSGTNLDIDDNRLELRKGKVVYQNGTSIIADANAEVFFSGTRHIGANAIGLEAQAVDRLTITNAQFVDMEIGVEILDFTAPAVSLYGSILHSTFTDNVVGVQVYDSEELFIYSSTFTGGSNAMIAVGVNSLHLNGCSVTGYANPIGAIYLEEVPEFDVADTDISNNLVGVYAPEHTILGTNNRVNMIFRRGSTIANNSQYGIYLEKGGIDANGLDYGLIVMDCAKLLDNQVGIAGTDVLLQIDAIENSGTNNPAFVRANTFRNLPNGLLFEVCYVDRTDITEVTAQGNYWDHPNISSTIQSLHKLQNSSIGSCATHFPNVQVDVSQFTTQLPTSCPAPPPGGGGTGGDAPTGKDCALNNANLGNSTGDQYAQAYRSYIYALDQENDTYPTRSFFQGMADTPDNVRNTASEQCRKYIDVARILSVDNYKAPKTKALQSSDQPASTLATEKQVDPSDIQVYPNPVATELVLNSVDPIGQLTLVNAMGQVVYTASTRETRFRINVSQFPAGLYTLVVTTADQAASEHKIIVQ